MDLAINSHFVIPSKELQWRFSRSSGPGGQKVNSTDSKVELIFNIKRSSVILPSIKERMLDKLEYVDSNGCIKIVVSQTRSQYQNRQLALNYLEKYLKEALKSSTKARKATQPTKASKERRIASKKQQSTLKRMRSNNWMANE